MTSNFKLGTRLTLWFTQVFLPGKSSWLTVKAEGSLPSNVRQTLFPHEVSLLNHSIFS